MPEAIVHDHSPAPSAVGAAASKGQTGLVYVCGKEGVRTHKHTSTQVGRWRWRGAASETVVSYFVGVAGTVAALRPRRQLNAGEVCFCCRRVEFGAVAVEVFVVVQAHGLLINVWLHFVEGVWQHGQLRFCVGSRV